MESNRFSIPWPVALASGTTHIPSTSSYLFPPRQNREVRVLIGFRLSDGSDFLAILWRDFVGVWYDVSKSR